MPPSLRNSKVFTPIKVGNVQLQHHIAMAPLTRFRADEIHVHQGIAVQYYEQRASVPGTLIVTEGTFISEDAGGYGNVPGIWNDEQIQAWKKVTDAVHAKGSFIFCQLWALGRSAKPSFLKQKGYDVVSASAVPTNEKSPVPRALTQDEIRGYVAKYTQAAKNAIAAGFDGVELHGANGYLLDQFMSSRSNKREDVYGGSIGNRTRFVREIIASVTAAIGNERTAIRMSPWGKFANTRMEDPIPTFSYLISHLAREHSTLAYISLVEPRAAGDGDQAYTPGVESNEFAQKIWAPRPLLLAGGWSTDVEGAAREVEKNENVILVFGRAFIPNPDLPNRLKYGLELTPYNRKTFYTRGPTSTIGYIDYPNADVPAPVESRL